MPCAAKHSCRHEHRHRGRIVVVDDMKETSDILAGFELLRAEDKPAALATVVAVCGSAYRRPGARMLIAADGRTWGGVSGGCLERDVALRAQAIFGTSETLNCRYDTTEDEDLATGVATGCRGTVDLFIESMSAECPGPIPWLAEAKRNRRDIALATVIRSMSNSIAPAAMRVTLESPIVGSALADAGSTVSRSPASAEADTACAPLSLVLGGEGWGEGRSFERHPSRKGPSPHPSPLYTGERESDSHRHRSESRTRHLRFLPANRVNRVGWASSGYLRRTH